MRSKSIRASLGTVAAMTMTMIGSGVRAQIAPPPQVGPPEGATDAAPPERDADIVVTASRARSPFAAPTPTQVMTAADLERRGATSLAAIIQEIPAFGTKNTTEGNGGRPSTTGQNFADLRGLGSFRTLVLIDGRRTVPQVPASNITNPYQVDLNVIPSLMAERIEVVTGGASAQWGSDAVAGVVNIILKKRLEGVQGEIQSGVSQEGDGAEYRIGLIGGISLSGGRGHLLLAGDYVRNNGISGAYSRDWAQRSYGQATDTTATAANGQPVRVGITDTQFGNRSPGGLITGTTGIAAANAANLIGREFASPTATRPFARGLYNLDTTITGTTTRSGRFQAIQQGGGYPLRLSDVDLVAEVERKVLYGHADYEIADGIEFFVEGSYSNSRGTGGSTATSSNDTGGVYNPTTGIGSQVRIYADNPFIPADIRPWIAAPAGASTATPPAQSFVLARANFDFGRGVNTVRNTVYSARTGLNGELGGGWSWDASYGYGHNKYVRISTLQRDRQLYALAADAVRNPANPAQIICRSAIANPNNGCVPVNLLGEGSPSAAAIDFFTDTVTPQNIYTQHTAQANLQGQPFSTWAGPVSFAAGAEWRRETLAVSSDPKTPTGVYDTTGATTPFTGQFSVKEGYLEATAPLASNVSFAHSLSVNAAVRYADYSNLGGVTTWKVGSTYEPVQGILLRAALSRDIRAPSLYELFLPGTTNFINTSFKGISYTGVRQVSSGNPDLRQEDAKTLTVGVSLSPPLVPGLRLSLDYYRIKVSGAIAIAGPFPIVQNCEAGIQSFCDQLIFATPGDMSTSLVGMKDQFINFSRFFTKGVDFTASYDTEFAGGHLNLRSSVAYVPTFQTITPAGGGQPDVVREYAGGVGSGSSSNFPVPKWKGVFSATYSKSPFSITGHVRYIHKGRQSTTLSEAPTATAPADIAPEDNKIPAYAYFSLSGTLDVIDQGRAQFFWVVNNVFNTDPPAIPSATLQIQTNGSNYDIIGRYYRVGLRFKF